MGLDYSYELYFHRNKLWDVLNSVASMQRPTVSEERINVILPDRKITLPFMSKFKTEPIYFNDSIQRLEFDTSLYFDVDEEIENYIEETKEHFRRRTPPEEFTPKFDQFGRYPVGYIYLSVVLDMNMYSVKEYKTDINRFRFMAATTSMSLLFQNSSSIRTAFVHLLEKHEGICGIFDDETYCGPIFWPEHLAPTDYEVVDKLLKV